MQETGTYINIREVTPVGDKEQRAQSIAARVAMGKVYFPKDKLWTEKAIDQLLQFPNGTHDDFVDALSYIGLGLRSQFKPSAPKTDDKEPKYGTLGFIKQYSAWQDKQKSRQLNGGF
jgi:hypothetical protein